MVKRYEGNTGRVTRVEERTRDQRPPESRQEVHTPQHPSEPRREDRSQQRPPAFSPPRDSSLPRQLQRLLSGTLGDMETEDLLLLLILYLLYRESGDQDWLVTLGAMLFL